jgi:hypothetical protein
LISFTIRVKFQRFKTWDVTGIVFKASIRHRLGAKAQLEVKASRRLGKWSKVTLCRRQRLLEQGSDDSKRRRRHEQRRQRREQWKRRREQRKRRRREQRKKRLA